MSESGIRDDWAIGAASFLIVGTAVAVDPGGWYPFGPLRWALISTGVLGVATLTLRRRIEFHRASAVGWLLFLGWGSVASVVALDPLYTWLGTPDRHLGMVTVALFAVAFVVGQNLASDGAIRGLVRAAAAALAIIGAYTLLEVLGIAPVDLATPSGRPGGPFGSAAYLGAASALLLPITIGGAVEGLGSPAWRYVAVAASSLGGFAALASQTRAGWVGLAAAFLVSLPALAGWVQRRRPVVIAAAAGLILLAVLTPIGARLGGALDFTDGTARGRIDEWQVGAAVVVNHPVTGVGFEGYRIAFAEGVDADYERRYTRVTMPDRAHNGPLDVGAATGLPGMVLYLAAIGFLGRRAWRATRAGEAVPTGIAAGVVGYAAQQFFLFPLAEVDPLFWLFSGVLVATTAEGPTVGLEAKRGLWLVPAALAAVALIAGCLDIVADRQLANAGDLTARSELEAAYESALDATLLRPDSIRYHFSAAATAALGGTAEWLDLAVVRLDDALELSPGDPILRAEHASFQLRVAAITRDSSLLADATREWEALVEDDPFHARYRLELGNAYALGGSGPLAEAQWLITADLAPRSTAPFTNLALLYLEAGRGDAAQAALDQARMIDPEAPEIRAIEEVLKGR